MIKRDQVIHNLSIMAVFNVLWSAPSISFTYFLRAPADWFTIKEPVQQLCQKINIREKTQAL